MVLELGFGNLDDLFTNGLQAVALIDRKLILGWLGNTVEGVKLLAVLRSLSVEGKVG